MPTLESIAIFALASAVLILIPGPAVLYIVARSVHQGRTAGIVSALGVEIGSMVHIVGAALGLSAILVSSSVAFSAVKFAGAAYLIYLGIRTLLAREATSEEVVIAPMKLRRPRSDLHSASSLRCRGVEGAAHGFQNLGLEPVVDHRDFGDQAVNRWIA